MLCLNNNCLFEKCLLIYSQYDHYRMIDSIISSVSVFHSYNSFIFEFETSAFTWSFNASKIIFDISCVISSTFKAILVKLWPGPTCMYACIICKSLSLNNLIFFHILVHFCIFWVFVPPHNTLEMLKFYFGFQLLKFFLELNEPPLPSYVICIWIRLIK